MGLREEYKTSTDRDYKTKITMPLTVQRQLYKNFPGMFADGMTQQFQKRSESYRSRGDEEDMEDLEVSEMSQRDALKPHQSTASSGRPPQELPTPWRSCRSCTPVEEESENSNDCNTENSNDLNRTFTLRTSQIYQPMNTSPSAGSMMTSNQTKSPVIARQTLPMAKASNQTTMSTPIKPSPPSTMKPSPPPAPATAKSAATTKASPASQPAPPTAAKPSAVKLAKTRPSTASCPRGLKLDMTRRRESPSPRGTSKRETPSPQTTGSFANVFKVIRPRQSPRTTVSLDAVDLWEDDDDDASQDGTGGSEFDEIDGVVINPSKTFDFSDLSRSPVVACKRNKIEHKKMAVADSIKISVKNLESQQNRGTNSGRISPGRSSSGRVSPGRVSPGRVSPGRVSPGRVSPGRVSPGRRKSPRELRAWKPRPRIAGRHKNIFPGFGPDPEPSKAEPQPHTVRPDSANNSLLKSVDGRLPIVPDQQSDSNFITNGNGRVLNKRLSLLRSKTDFSLHRLKEEVEMVSDSADETESLNSTGGERKVKFNNQVTVRDGEMNTVDELRNSNNSAQMFKKKYLFPQSWTEEFPELNGNLPT